MLLPPQLLLLYHHRQPLPLPLSLLLHAEYNSHEHSHALNTIDYWRLQCLEEFDTRSRRAGADTVFQQRTLRKLTVQCSAASAVLLV